MGKCNAIVEEIRFDIRDPDLTHVYVISRAEGDCPLGVEGCHHKVFPASEPIKDILGDGHITHYLEWDLGAPDEDTEKVNKLQERVRALETAILNHFQVTQIPTSMLRPTEKALLDLVNPTDDQSTHQS